MFYIKTVYGNNKNESFFNNADEIRYKIFTNINRIEELDEHPEFKKMWAPALQQCLSCHSGGGVRSLNSLQKIMKPDRRQQDPPDNGAYPTRWWMNDGSEAFKQERFDWGLLNGYWNTPRGNLRPHSDFLQIPQTFDQVAGMV